MSETATATIIASQIDPTHWKLARRIPAAAVRA